MPARSALIVILLAAAMITVPLAAAAESTRNPDPLAVAWYVTDAVGNPVNGAWLTIYYSTSPDGPFTPVPENDPATNTHVEDRIPNPDIWRNPVITGYWNPDHPSGMAFADVHVWHISNYYFYVQVNAGGSTSYWPTAASTKPRNPSWAPVKASGSPSGYAAAGNGLGTGPTTAYHMKQPPNNMIPEVPLGPSIATVTMILGMIGYVGMRRRNPKYPH